MDCDKWVEALGSDSAKGGNKHKWAWPDRCFAVKVLQDRCDVCARPAVAAAVKSDADLWVQLEFFIEYCEQFTTRNRDWQAGSIGRKLEGIKVLLDIILVKFVSFNRC